MEERNLTFLQADGAVIFVDVVNVVVDADLVDVARDGV